MRVLINGAVIAGLLITGVVSSAQAQVSPLGGTTGLPAGSPPPAITAPGGRMPSGMRPRGPGTGRTLQERFEAANTARDGRLTPEQAGAMPAVARNFEAIDTGRKGYVTIDDIRSYNRAKRAERRAERRQNRQP